VSEAGKARTWILAWLASAVVGLGILAGVGCAVSANACIFKKSKPVTSTDGETLYLSFCIGCHGRSGEGGRGPSLRAGAVATYDLETLIAKVSNGKPLAGMPKFGKPAVGRQALTPEQLRAVSEYVVSLRSEPSPS
jgi:mono/diheme cytochrome c family protein